MSIQREPERRPSIAVPDLRAAPGIEARCSVHSHSGYSYISCSCSAFIAPTLSHRLCMAGLAGPADSARQAQSRVVQPRAHAGFPSIRLSSKTHTMAASVWQMHQFPEVNMSRAESEADMLRRDGPRLGLQAPPGSNGDAHSTPSSALRHSFESKRKADVNHQGHMEVRLPRGTRNHQPQML